MPELVRSERWTGPNAGLPDELGGPVSEWLVAKKNREDHQRSVAAGKAPRRPSRGDGWRITDADERLLSALSRHGVMTWRQASRAFYGGVSSTTNKRIGYLREAGLLEQSDDDRWAGQVLIGTKAGHRLIRREMLVPISPATRSPGERLLHRLAATDLGLRLEERGARLLTERELRTAEGNSTRARETAESLGVPITSVVDGRKRERWFCVPLGQAGAVHYPDLIIVTDEGLMAVEVEITVKPAHRTREIIRGYRDSRLFNQVLYYTSAPVAALLHGTRDEATGEWAEGILQFLRLIPYGPAPGAHGAVDAAYGPHHRVQVRPFTPRDPGVAYRLDMRVLPDGVRANRTEWKRLRTKWEADPEGKAARVPFLRWWQNIEIPRRKDTRRTA